MKLVEQVAAMQQRVSIVIMLVKINRQTMKGPQAYLNEIKG